MSNFTIGNINNPKQIIVGDNSLMINKNSSTDSNTEEKIKILLDKFRSEVEVFSSVGTDKKADILDRLRELEEKINIPVTGQHSGGLVCCWEKLIGTIKDAGQLLAVARELGKVIGLPLP